MKKENDEVIKVVIKSLETIIVTYIKYKLK